MLAGIVLFNLSVSFAYAQAPATYNSADIYLQLKKLNVLGSVLYIAAHPDDENTRLLAYFSKEKQYRTGYLSLTRGDGGQNLIGDEQGIELGLIRTQELLAARRIDGAEQFFSRAFDFGFSKSADEAFKIWGHDKILSDVVWMIRKFQPDIIITRFPGDTRAGHGHHWASALLANEAFKIAGDETKFTEQFKYGVKPWQPKRILWNTFNFGNTNTTAPDQFKIETGDFNRLLGKGYGEIASESRSQHKSQGFGVPKQRGQSTEFFTTTGGDAPTRDLMEGIVTTWDRVDGGLAIEKQVDEVIAKFSFDHPEASVPALVQLYQAIGKLPDGYWKNKKQEEVKQLIVACSGLFAEATTANEYVVAGDSMRVNFFVNKQNNTPLQWDDVKLLTLDTVFNEGLPYNSNITFSKSFGIPVTAKPTQPYWLEKPLDNGGSFDVQDQTLIGNAQATPAFTAVFNFSVGNVKFAVNRPVMAKYTDAVKGELYQPVVVIPPVTISASPAVALTTVNGHATNSAAHLRYKTNLAEKDMPVTIEVGSGLLTGAGKDTIINSTPGQEFETTLPFGRVKSTTGGQYGSVKIKSNGGVYQYDKYLRTIQYDHIPHINYFYDDKIIVVTDDIKTVGHKIGYIAGAGDKVPQALVQMGYQVTMLGTADLTDENLAQYDALIAGVRAYDVDAFLTAKYDVLMRYVHNGGNLIAQYNRSNQIGSQIKVGPYPFTVSSARITDEKADVHVLLPEHPALNYPNKITPKDFEGWVQERSIYHATTKDANYVSPIAMHDPNEPENSGSLIIAKYGKGNFVYTGIVFFRQLPAGVSGAYRLMANLIALPKN